MSSSYLAPATSNKPAVLNDFVSRDPSRLDTSATVVVVADHGSALASVHEDLRSCLRGLAAQEFDEPIEVLLVESTEHVSQLPPDVLAIVAGLRVIPVDSLHSYDLKNAGARAANSDIVVLLDADCTPSPQWLQAAVQHLRANPAASVVTGRIVYQDSGLVSRSLALLSRAHYDGGRVARTRFISNANGAYRREVLLRFPLCVEAGPFSGLLQSESMWRQGYRVNFDPAMRVVHAFEGWPMERDIRNQIGHATIAVRRLDPSMRFAWLLRAGVGSIAIFAPLRTLDSWWNCLRSAPAYDIRWWQLPVSFAIAVVVHALEVPGMIRAFRKQSAGRTDYR